MSELLWMNEDELRAVCNALVVRLAYLEIEHLFLIDGIEDAMAFAYRQGCQEQMMGIADNRIGEKPLIH